MDTMPITAKLFRPTEAARLLGLPLQSIYEMLCNGELPFIREGYSIRILGQSLHEWREAPPVL